MLIRLLVCLSTLLRWHGMHVDVHTLISFFIDGHTYLFFIIAIVLLIPGCAKSCIDSKIVCLYRGGMYGLKFSCEASHMSDFPFVSVIFF